MTYTFVPSEVCSRSVRFDIDENGNLHNLAFDGGCHGNTQGLCALAEGQPAAEISKRLQGISCRGKGTSCPDQLAQAIDKALKSR